MGRGRLQMIYSQTSLIRPIGPWTILGGLEIAGLAKSHCIITRPPPTPKSSGSNASILMGEDLFQAIFGRTTI